MEENMSTIKKMKPFVKWAGGKGSILNEIRKFYPSELGKSIDKYAEPFVGGGAVLFDVLANYDLKEIYISDINRELINTYIVIRDCVNELIAQLYTIQNEYIHMSFDMRKAYYYDKRECYNELTKNTSDELDIEKAVLFIFLNKTCFNGLYRVNKSGFFNVPMGAYKNPTICDEVNLLNLSVSLSNVQIACADYRESENFIDEKTFVYFDPPYRPLTETASFTSYTETDFNDVSQKELADYVNALNEKGAKIVVSNSDPKNIDINDTFFDDLYKLHNITRIQASRMINSKADSRGKISELLIDNC